MILRNDKEKSWVMQPDGTYIREEGGEGTSSQEALYRYFSTRKVSLTEEAPEKEEKTGRAAEEPAEKSRNGFFGWLKQIIRKG